MVEGWNVLKLGWKFFYMFNLVLVWFVDGWVMVYGMMGGEG